MSITLKEIHDKYQETVASDYPTPPRYTKETAKLVKEVKAELRELASAKGPLANKSRGDLKEQIGRLERQLNNSKDHIKRLNKEVASLSLQVEMTKQEKAAWETKATQLRIELFNQAEHATEPVAAKYDAVYKAR